MTHVEKIERNQEIYRAVMNGEKTQTQIAKEYDISRERVSQIIKAIRDKDTKPLAVTRKVVYPAIRDWMNENRITQTQFNNMTGYGEYYSAKETPLRRCLLGGDRVSIELIKKILEVTGLTFEEAFAREDIK